MARLLPILLALFGLGLGLGAGFFLRPPDAPATAGTEDAGQAAEDDAAAATQFSRIANQFIVPIVERGEMVSLVIASLGIESTPEVAAQVSSMEPKLRDAFLQVLFDHANSGGFRGAFTEQQNLAGLRLALLEAARKILGPGVKHVLISDLIRQDS